MTLECQSPCKINLLLNILGKRTDGYHEVETVLYPVFFCDRLHFEKGGQGIQFSCTHPDLPADSTNLVWRAASLFLQATRPGNGIRIHLEKNIPLGAGLGGGSSNAATTLLALNDLFDHPMTEPQLRAMARDLGADVPFFLQNKPALGTGRGEQIAPIECFPALRNAHLLLIHPGFGISTAWAYQQLARFPGAFNGEPGRARRLIALLESGDLTSAGPAFYNALEAPAFAKYPILALFQESLQDHGAAVARMSGSGSTIFAIFDSEARLEEGVHQFKRKFDDHFWMRTLPLQIGPRQ
ncbi:MAG: 4-(cytidine 5'-diphospho)-2-C-methyl-D-erythritol kinase [Candidatus Omnitrophica bacterium]|nr:4-(cytidine 5'-diphospho)-2-C-methyl-D-erythritol kinase [Candidatus Omnitrophota bacterium]